MLTNQTKITLSDKELELVCNTEWILTKQAIIKKVIELLGSLLQPMQVLTALNKNLLPTAPFLKDAKISRGESYKSLPYVILDYPRFFYKNDTLAIRTLFWWGNFFSINLQLSGKFKEQFEPVLVKKFRQLQQQQYWLCVGNDPWQHNFEEDNYVPLQHFTLKSFKAILKEKTFIKIGKKIDLLHWNTVAPFVEQSFTELINLLKSNYLADETSL